MVTSCKLLIDLGAGHALSLEKFSARKDFADQFIEGNLSIGLNGPIKGYLGRVKAMCFGKCNVQNPMTSFPRGDITRLLSVTRDGSVGIDLLKRFTIIFDYQQGMLYFRKLPFLTHHLNMI